MFALVLKNSILMLLIIFIIHFMILNYAKEMTPTSINLKMSSFTNSIMSLKQSQSINNSITSRTGTTTTVSNDPKINDSDSTALQDSSDTCQNNELIDLYNFVFHEDETADFSQLNTYFPDDSHLKSNHVDVPCSQQPKEGASKQFCLNEVDAFFEKNSKPVVITSSKENEKSTSAGNHPIIHEYKESHNGLIGYETYESSYMHF
jgi:hypothetical protein